MVGMARPKAYEPMEGYKYQIFVKTPYDRAMEHCDYAIDRKDLKHLIENYKQAYGAGHSFSWTLLPQKYWV